MMRTTLAIVLAGIALAFFAMGFGWGHAFEAKKRREHIVASMCARGAGVMMTDVLGLVAPMYWCEAVEMNGRTVHVKRRFPDDVQPMRISFGDNFKGRMRIVIEEAE